MIRFLMTSAVAVLTLGAARAQNVFVTDFYQTNSILRVNALTGTAAPPPVDPGIILPSGLAYGPDGFLYATNQSVPAFGLPGTISKINPATGHVVSTIGFSTPVNPGGLTFAPNGDLYVTDFVDQNTPGTGTVAKYSISGNVASRVGAPLATGLNQPSRLLINGNNLYFTEVNTSTFSGGRLSVVNVAGGPVTPLVTGTPGTGFSGLALEGTTLYYTDLFAGAIDRYDIANSQALTALVAPGPTSSLNNQFPGGLFIDALGSILVANLGSVDPNGTGNPGNGNLRRYSTLVPDTQLGPDLVSNIYGGSVINAVPEPGTFALVGAAVAGFAAWQRRKKP
jgi:PEP-CTERM motif